MVLVAQKWRSFVGENVQQQLQTSTKVCVCAFICFVSVGMPDCSINGMLVELCDGNAQDNGSCG